MTPQQRYYRKNRSRLLRESKERYHNNINYELNRSKIYREDNKEEIKNRRNRSVKQKRQTDPAFKIKSNVSRAIRHIFKKNNSSKLGEPILRYLQYTAQELKIHLEKQFEPWMNWNNYGKYVKNKWNDYDQSTWTWNIDHIIPQSDLPYTSMKDENFKKCWSLSNLRPLASKINFIDGITRIRHRDNK